MPVSDKHPAYDKFRAQWQRIQDVLDGEDAVKDRGEEYLARIYKATDEEYGAYRLRAGFFGATRRTWEAMAGFIFRKPPTIKTKLDKSVTEDVDMKGATLAGYCRKVTGAACGKGRAGTLIDWNEKENRPFLSFYAAEDIINWNITRINGRMALTLLVLREWDNSVGGDGFMMEAKEQWLVFRLTDAGVTREVWQANTPGDGLNKQDTPAPGAVVTIAAAPITRRSDALTDIPFVFHNSDEPGACVSVPPLADISSVNIHHYQASAELENARHACATPTPYAIGFGNDDTKLYLGTSYAWTTPNLGATCGFLEPQGNGLPSLEKSLEEKERQMAALGARLIEPPKKDAEAFETVQLRASAETSTLAKIGLLTSEGLSEVLQWVEWWAGTVKDREDLRDITFVALNSDYASARMTPQELTALVASWQQGAISQDTFFFAMQRGEMYPEGRTLEEERRLIEKFPAMPGVSGLDEDGNPIHGAPPPEPEPPEPAAK